MRTVVHGECSTYTFFFIWIKKRKRSKKKNKIFKKTSRQHATTDAVRTEYRGGGARDATAVAATERRHWPAAIFDRGPCFDGGSDGSRSRAHPFTKIIISSSLERPRPPAVRYTTLGKSRTPSSVGPRFIFVPFPSDFVTSRPQFPGVRSRRAYPVYA